jgi:hypothetical protein
MSYQLPARRNPWFSPPALQYVARMNPPAQLSAGWRYALNPPGNGFEKIRPGDLVTIRDRFGRHRTGHAVKRGGRGWVLNMGGGRPGLANPQNTSKINGMTCAAYAIFCSPRHAPAPEAPPATSNPSQGWHPGGGMRFGGRYHPGSGRYHSGVSGYHSGGGRWYDEQWYPGGGHQEANPHPRGYGFAEPSTNPSDFTRGWWEPPYIGGRNPGCFPNDNDGLDCYYSNNPRGYGSEGFFVPEGTRFKKGRWTGPKTDFGGRLQQGFAMQSEEYEPDDVESWESFRRHGKEHRLGDEPYWQGRNPATGLMPGWQYALTNPHEVEIACDFCGNEAEDGCHNCGDRWCAGCRYEHDCPAEVGRNPIDIRGRSVPTSFSKTGRFHHVRVGDPDEYTSIRTKTLSERKGIKARMGRFLGRGPRGGKTEVQSYMFDAEMYTPEDVARWFEGHPTPPALHMDVSRKEATRRRYKVYGEAKERKKPERRKVAKKVAARKKKAKKKTARKTPPDKQRCKAKKGDGSRCKGWKQSGKQKCSLHASGSVKKAKKKVAKKKASKRRKAGNPPKTKGPACGHSVCSQHYVETGRRLCLKKKGLDLSPGVKKRKKTKRGWKTPAKAQRCTAKTKSGTCKGRRLEGEELCALHKHGVARTAQSNPRKKKRKRCRPSRVKRCAGQTNCGKKCKAYAVGRSKYCVSHKKAGTRTGRTRGSRG